MRQIAWVLGARAYFLSLLRASRILRRCFRKRHATAHRTLLLWAGGRIHLSRIRIWQLRQGLPHHSNDPNLRVRTTTRAMSQHHGLWRCSHMRAVGPSEISLLPTWLAILGSCSRSVLSTSVCRTELILAISRVWILAGLTWTAKAKIFEEKTQNCREGGSREWRLGPPTVAASPSCAWKGLLDGMGFLLKKISWPSAVPAAMPCFHADTRSFSCRSSVEMN